MSNDNQQLATFEVGSLDFGSFTDATPVKARPLTKPGQYDLKITRHKLSVSENGRDGAGKMWGRLYMSAETLDGNYFMNDFIDVPLEALEHTSKKGVKTKVKGQIFIGLIQALVGRRIQLGELKSMIENLPSLLNGAVISAVTSHKAGPRVSFLKDVEGAKKFGIILRATGKNPSETIYQNGDGTLAVYETREEAMNAYKAMTGITPSQGLGFTIFKTKSEAKDEVVESVVA